MSFDGYLLAKNYAFKLLSFRPRSVEEIKTKLNGYLHKKGFKSILSEKIIGELKEQNYLNDLEFTKWWIGQRSNSAIRGVRVIKMELKSKGISPDIIESVLNSKSKENETQKAAKTLEKLLRKLPKSLSSIELRVKLNNHLLRRGFDFETTKKAIDEILKKG